MRQYYDDTDLIVKSELINELVKEFKQDNPRFDEQKFRNACKR